MLEYAEDFMPMVQRFTEEGRGRVVMDGTTMVFVVYSLGIHR